MKTTTPTADIALNNSQEVLAHCLLTSHATYLRLVEDGTSADIEELGKTVRRLACCLTEVTFPFDGFDDDDGDDPDGEEAMDEDVDVSKRLHRIK